MNHGICSIINAHGNQSCTGICGRELVAGMKQHISACCIGVLVSRKQVYYTVFWTQVNGGEETEWNCGISQRHLTHQCGSWCHWLIQKRWNMRWHELKYCTSMLHLGSCCSTVNLNIQPVSEISEDKEKLRKLNSHLWDNILNSLLTFQFGWWSIKLLH